MKQQIVCGVSRELPWWVPAGLLLAGCVLGGLYIANISDLKWETSLVDGVSVLYALGLVLLCFRGLSGFQRHVRRVSTGAQGTRRFIPALLGCGVLCFAVGLLVRLCNTLSTGREPTYPALPHFLYLGTYPFFIAAFLLLPAGNLSLLSRLRMLFDSLIVLTVVATLYAYYLLVPLLVLNEGTLLEKIIGSLFPSADLVLLFCLLFVAMQAKEDALQQVLVLLGVATVVSFAGHVIFLWSLLSDAYQVTIRTNAFFLFGLALITLAAYLARRMLASHEHEEPGPVVLLEEANVLVRWKTLGVYVLVLLFGLLFSIWMPSEARYPSKGLVADIGGALLLVLLVCRQFLEMIEVQHLRRDLGVNNARLQELNTQLAQQAITDPLTGLANHRALVERLDEALRQAQEKQLPCAVLFADLDHFKAINDRYGHLQGDLVLCRFAALALAVLDQHACLGRWGGEEFVGVLPGKDLQEAFDTAEQVRQQSEQQIFTEMPDLRVTCSLGIAVYPRTSQRRDELLAFADQALYAAKSLGRNQTCTAPDPVLLAMQEPLADPE